MNETPMTTKKALTVLGVTLFLVLLTLVVPASWVGVEPTKKQPRQLLLLKTREELFALQSDTNKNNTPDWRDTLLSSVSPEIQTLVEKKEVTEKEKIALEDKNNLTTSFAKNIYTVSSYLKQGAEISPEDQAKTIASLIKTESERIETKTYTIKDLSLTKEETVATKKAYGNTLGMLLQKADTYNLGDNDLGILEKYNTTKDVALLQQFTEKKKGAEIILSTLLTTKVPFSAGIYHLNLVNNLSRYIEILDSLSKTDTDPLRSLASFQNYLPIVKDLFSSMSALSKYFSLQNITFSQKEAGALLLAK